MSVQHASVGVAECRFHVVYVVGAGAYVIGEVALLLNFAPEEAVEGSARLEEAHVLAGHAGVAADAFCEASECGVVGTLD